MTTQHTADADAIAELVTDHREVAEMFAELERTPAAGADTETLKQRKDLVDRAIMELIRHSVAEEEYLYPAARKALPDHDTEHDISEHSEAELTMKTLDRLTPADADFEPTLATLMQQVRRHIAEEEGDLFPKLRQALSQDELDQLGDKLRKAKKAAPTRPHPGAPDHPPFNKVLGPGTSLVDKVRDALSNRGGG